MEEYLMLLESDDPAKRLEGVKGLKASVDDPSIDARAVVAKLKELILDWDDAVRETVAEALKLYTGR